MPSPTSALRPVLPGWAYRALLALALCAGLVLAWPLPEAASWAAPAFVEPHAASTTGRRGTRTAAGAAAFGVATAPVPGTTAAQLCGAAVGLAAAASAASAAAGAARGRRRPRAAAGRTQRRGWGDDVTFHEAAVKSNVEAAQGLRLISIEAPDEVYGAFAKPGQFVQAKSAADAKPSFYAISSPPGTAGPLEFLIKEAESNAWLTGAQSGDALQLSPAMGRGFNFECESWTEAQVNQVGLFATGSGIAPIRATIESGALAGKVSRLYFGSRSQESMPFADRFDDWKQRGVEVVPVLSKGGNSWTGRTGYVQDAFREDEERGEGFVLAARAGALLCGQKEMVAAVRSVYSDLGVPEDRTLLNF